MRLFFRKPAEPAISAAMIGGQTVDEFLRSTQVAVDQSAEAARGRNPAEVAFYEQTDRVVHKWRHYLEIYDRYLGRFRGTAVRLLEIGVFQGGSLQLWRRYLGPDAVIHGLDIDPRCAALSEPNHPVHVGSQTDTALLDRIVDEMGGVDIVIDDASHVGEHQIATFDFLYPRVSENGVYIVEDLHCAYWPVTGGGLRRPGTFMEHAKGLLDQLHARYVTDADLPDRDTAFADATLGISIHDSMAVFEKRAKPAPTHCAVGRRWLS